MVGWRKPPKVDHPSSYAKLRLAFTFILTSPGAPMIYYGDEVGMTGAQDPDNRRMLPKLDQLSSEERKVRDHVSKLNALRSAHPAMRHGSRRCLQADHDTYAVVRTYLGDRLLILYNRSEKTLPLTLRVAPEFQNGPLQDQVGMITKAEIKDNKLQITLPPLSSSVLTPLP